jgi:hypothetical protein
MVACQTFASWNHITGWLQRLDGAQIGRFLMIKDSATGDAGS